MTGLEAKEFGVADCGDLGAKACGHLEGLFKECERLGASDIHLAENQRPWMRSGGRLAVVEGASVLSRQELEAMLLRLCASTYSEGDCVDVEKRAYKQLKNGQAIDGAWTSLTGVRYRFNVYSENGRLAGALRRLDDKFRTLAELGLPEKLDDFCECRDGLVIVTGPTGSGKSTTLGTLLDRINRSREGHIVTIEDPVEYIHESRKCLVSQRQVGRDATGFNEALVEALRQDPDVILVGEIREVETIRTAITAAETGHLVFTTLHAGDCAGAVERIVSVFPAGEQDGIRHQLAMVLRGIFAQHLMRRARGEGRVVAGELMVVTQAIANLISSGRSNQLHSALETGGAAGMFTLDQSLVELAQCGKITLDAAMAMSKNREAFIKRYNAGRARME